MNTKELSTEQISAFVDGELSSAQVDAVLAALQTPEGMAAWEAYHLIGDVARSDDMALAMRPDFFAKLSARLDAEPTVIGVAGHRAHFASKLTARCIALPIFAVAVLIIFNLQSHPATVNSAVSVLTTVPAHQTADAAHGEAGVLRDARIDQFLDAQRRFPVPQKQLGRSAGFTKDSDK